MAKSLMLLSNPHRPDPRVLREARALTGAGHEIELLAWDREGERPRSAVEGGISVVRLGPRCPFRDPVRVLMRLPRFWFSALKHARGKGFDIVHAHDFDTIPLGLLIARLHGTPVLYDAHELYSKMISSEIGGLSGLMWPVERCCARGADGVVTVNAPMAETLSKGRRHPARIVTNSPDPSVLDGCDRKEVREKYGLRGFVLSYLGSLEPGRFVGELVDAFPPAGGVTVAIGGNGTLMPLAERASLHNPSVRFVGTVDTDEALRITWASDLVVSMLDPANPNYRVSTPVKVLDAMASSRPVVISEGLDMAKTVQRVGCGFVIPYEREAFLETVGKAMQSPALLAEMGEKGRAYFDRELSWTRSRDELLAAYRALARTP